MIAVRGKGESKVAVSERAKHLGLSVGRCISYPQGPLPFIVFHFGQEASIG